MKNYSLGRRSCTFDGMDVDTESQPVNDRVKQRLNKVMERIVSGVMRIVPTGISIQVRNIKTSSMLLEPETRNPKH